MKSFMLFIILFFLPSISFAEIPCSELADATTVVVDAPAYNVNVANFQYDGGGTCASINYDGQAIDGSSSFSFDVNVGVGTDQVVCGLIDGEPPSPLDFVEIDPTFRCTYNIMDVTGFIEAYAITGYPDATYEKVVNGSVNRTDMIQVYSPIATTIELPLRVSAGLTAIQSFCDPEHSVAEAKASLTASLGANSVGLTGVARVEGGFLDNTNPSVSQTISISVPAGVSTFAMKLEGELSARSTVRGVSPLGIIACGSNAVAIADNIRVGNFTGLNGTPLPEGLKIIGLDSGIDYVNPMEPLSCSNIPAPDIVVQDDNCGSGTGSATVTPIDTLNYEWSNGAIGAQANDLSYGTYFLTVSDDSGCSRDFYVFVDDPEAPEIILPELLTIEENEPITLVPTGTTDMLTYLWSTGDTSPTIEVSNEGAYSVTITTATGCEYVAETLVQESTPIDFSPCMSANYLFSGNADDISGNDNHGTVFGATLTEDRNGRPESAYYFDGVNDYIEFPASAETQPDSGLTFTAWFKSDDLPEDTWGTIIKNTGQGYELALNKIKNGGISSNLDLQSGSNFSLNSRLNEYADNQWHSLAITYDGNSGIYRLFIDGNLNGESLGSIDAIAYQTGTPFTIGRNGISNSNYFKGAIDDVKIFNCALNVDELSFLFAQQPDFDCYTEIYFEDFEGEIGGEWLDTITYEIIHPTVDTVKMLGRFTNNAVSLTLPNAPINSLVSVCFDLWVVDSWDGNHQSYGFDIFSVYLSNSRSLISSTFSNFQNFSQTYPSNYNVTNTAENLRGTGAEITGDINGEWTSTPTGGPAFDSKYNICRTFMNTNDTLNIIFESYLTANVGVNNEAWGIDNVSVLIPPTTLNTEEETITCNSDGSYIVSVPFTSNGDNINYMAYEQGNTFGDIDTLFFTDDGTISSIEMPYPSGRDYNIIIAVAGDMSDCYPVISGTTECTFTESCNLSASFTDECVGDSLVITGTIIGGTSPYSVYSDAYNTVLFPDDGNTFTFTIQSCFPQAIDFTITDFNMCEYNENIAVNTEFPTDESSCFQSLTLHPNPVKSALNISFSEFCDNSNIKIYDSLGQLMRSDILTDSNVSYDVSTLPKGMYFLYLDNEKDRYVEKFIKI